jgi:ATP-dependent DNA ligase
MRLPVMPPVLPMLAKAAPEIPAGQVYEPKWDGFRTIVFRDGDEVELGSRNTKPMTRYFPEVVQRVRSELPPRCVVDGEIVIAAGDATGLDFEALLQRIHPAESRVRLLAEQTPAMFVAFDLLALDDEDLTGLPFRERRARLEAAVRGGGPGVYVTRATEDLDEARRWFEVFEGAGLDGVVAKDPEVSYLPDKRVMTKVKHERTADCVRAGYRTHKNDDEAIGSLLLGLYDEAGLLDHVGFTSTIRDEERAALTRRLERLKGPPGFTGKAPGGPSRWSTERSGEWEPLPHELVVEVRYDHVTGDRFRHGTKLLRWRPDKAPRQCTFAQIEREARPGLIIGEVVEA